MKNRIFQKAWRGCPEAFFKILMAITVLGGLTIGLTVMGCGDGGGGKDITIIGNMYNEAISGKPAEGAGTIRTGSAAIDSEYSTLRTENPIRHIALSVTEQIIINGTIHASEKTLMDGVDYAVWIEHPDMLTPERWGCSLRYDCPDGSCSIGTLVWELNGGILGNEESVPLFPDCDGEPAADPAFICDVDRYNCANPYWTTDYTLPGDGLLVSYGTVTSNIPRTSITFEIGRQGGFPPRMDVLARYEVYTPDGSLADRKDYIFDLH